MIEFTTLEGAVVYVAPHEIILVTPAYAEASAAIPNHMQIPRILGSKVILRNGFQMGVKGQPEQVAKDVGAAQAGRPPLDS